VYRLAAGPIFSVFRLDATDYFSYIGERVRTGSTGRVKSGKPLFQQIQVDVLFKQAINIFFIAFFPDSSGNDYNNDPVFKNFINNSISLILLTICFLVLLSSLCNALRAVSVN